jgi:hypothetical protein
MTQEIDGFTPEQGKQHASWFSPLRLNLWVAQRNYGNLAPEQAMHGIVFRFARDSWVRNIQTFMTGSHPVSFLAPEYRPLSYHMGPVWLC